MPRITDVGAELAEVPFGDFIANVAQGIAEGQRALDLTPNGTCDSLGAYEEQGTLTTSNGGAGAVHIERHTFAPSGLTFDVKFQLVDPDKRPELVEQMKITALRSVHLQYGNESFVVTNPSEEAITNGIIRKSLS